jgi:hypothetical protein
LSAREGGDEDHPADEGWDAKRPREDKGVSCFIGADPLPQQVPQVLEGKTSRQR